MIQADELRCPANFAPLELIGFGLVMRVVGGFYTKFFIAQITAWILPPGVVADLKCAGTRIAATNIPVMADPAPPFERAWGLLKPGHQGVGGI